MLCEQRNKQINGKSINEPDNPQDGGDVGSSPPLLDDNSCINEFAAQKMGAEVELIGNYRYRNILANGNVPILFVVVCFLIIANSRCDQVGSTNGK